MLPTGKISKVKCQLYVLTYKIFFVIAHPAFSPTSPRPQISCVVLEVINQTVLIKDGSTVR